MTNTMLARILACIIMISGISIFTVDQAHAQWGCNNPSIPDDDQDGIPDVDEPLFMGNPCDDDTDDDGIKDGEEAFTYGTFVNKADSDFDGLTDGQEILQVFSNPMLADTNNSGLTDLQALNMGLDPSDEDGDHDNDGLKDGVEVHAGTSVFVADSDQDGASDYDEMMVLGTDPTIADSEASFQAACNALSSANTVVVCNGYSSGEGTPTLNKTEGAQDAQVQGCASAGGNTSGIPSYFLLFAMMAAVKLGLRKREEA